LKKRKPNLSNICFTAAGAMSELVSMFVERGSVTRSNVRMVQDATG